MRVLGGSLYNIITLITDTYYLPTYVYRKKNITIFNITLNGVDFKVSLRFVVSNCKSYK